MTLTKIIICSCLFLLFPFFSHSQEMVINGDFESGSQVIGPAGNLSIQTATNWNSLIPGKSPDLFWNSYSSCTYKETNNKWRKYHSSNNGRYAGFSDSEPIKGALTGTFKVNCNYEFKINLAKTEGFYNCSSGNTNTDWSGNNHSTNIKVKLRNSSSLNSKVIYTATNIINKSFSLHNITFSLNSTEVNHAYNEIILEIVNGGMFSNNDHPIFVDDVSILPTGLPSSSFTLNKTEICPGQSINAVASVTSGTHNWFVYPTGSGQGSSVCNTSNCNFPFTTSGNYTIKHTLTSSCGVDVSYQTVIVKSVCIGAITSQVSCQGGSNGSASINVTSGTAPYSYSWSHNGSISTSSAGNLSAGGYSVTVTDNQGATATTSFTIAEPQINHSLVYTTGCNNSNTINIFSSASSNHTINFIEVYRNGTLYNTYPWSSNLALMNLPGGNYQYKILYTGNNLTCSTPLSSGQFLLYSLSLTTSQTNNTCKGDDVGAASILITGGTPPFSYLWSTGSTASSISSLLAGAYSVTVTDATGCSATSTVTITEPNINFNHTKVDACNNNGSGSITVNASFPAGYSASAVQFYNNGSTYTTVMGNLPTTISGLASGSYTYIIIYGQGGSGCSYTMSSPINIIPDFQISTSIVDESCFGKEDGEITTSVSGGTGNFTYNWSTGSNQSNISGLGGGLVTLTVNDQGVCSKTRNFNVGSTPVEWQQTSKLNSGNDRGYDVAVDSQGNTYFVGTYYEYTVLGKTNSWTQIPYNNQEAVNNMFLVKIDDCGEIVWARHSDSNSKYEYCEGRALVLDEDNDRVFVAAYTNNAKTIRFIDEIAPINHLSLNGLNAYTIVVEYQMSNGDLTHLYDNNTWCPDKTPVAITIDNNSKYLYLVGNFPYGSNGFIERLDIDNQTFDHYLDLPTTIMTDVEFNQNTEQLFISGSYSGDVNFPNQVILHPGNSTQTPYNLGFIAEVREFNAPGLIPNPDVFDLVWSSDLGNDLGSNSQVNDMSINAMNNIAMTGYYEGTLIEPFNNPNINNGQGFSSVGTDVFVAYVDQNGQWNQQQSWMEVASQSSYSVGNGITFNDAGTLFIHGDYTNSDLEFGGQNAAYLGGTQTFSIAFENQGTMWASNWMATTKAGSNAQYEVYSNAIAANDDYIFTTGIYINTLDFSPTGNSSSITGGSDAYAYFVRNDINDNGKFQRIKNTSSIETTKISSLEVYPNPSSGNFNLVFETETYTNITVHDLTGKVVREIQLTNEENNFMLDLTEQPNGIYLVTATGSNERETIKISKQ